MSTYRQMFCGQAETQTNICALYSVGRCLPITSWTLVHCCMHWFNLLCLIENGLCQFQWNTTVPPRHWLDVKFVQQKFWLKSCLYAQCQRSTPLNHSVIGDSARSDITSYIQTDAFLPGGFVCISNCLSLPILWVQILQVAFTALRLLWRKNHCQHKRIRSSRAQKRAAHSEIIISVMSSIYWSLPCSKKQNWSASTKTCFSTYPLGGSVALWIVPP